MPKLVRITTIPLSLDKLLTGQLKFMTSHKFDVVMISSPADNTPMLEERELSKFIPVNMTRTISPIKDFIALIKLIVIFNKLKPEIVHTHTPKAGLLGMMAAWIARVPIKLHTIAGLPLMEATGIKRKLLEQIERLTYACANQVYPNSIKLNEFIISNKFCKPSKSTIIGGGSSNGINTAYFKLTPELVAAGAGLKLKYHIEKDDFTYIFVGRLVKDKGIEELITAFAEISHDLSKVKLLLVGPTEQELNPLSVNSLNEIENNPNIIQVDFQSDIRPYLAISNALVFPSYREGFPNVPMQAGCFELPCIVSDINGCNEIIEDEKNGLIIPVKNTVALKVAMLRLVNDNALYLKLQQNSRPMIVERYEQNKFWLLLLKEYQEQIAKHNVVS